MVDTIFKALAPACPERVTLGTTPVSLPPVPRGKAALPNGVYVVRKNGAIERFATGKVNPLRLDEGDGYAVEIGGGGGFGDPLARPAEQVLRDVTSGYVSVEAARRDYGVAINAVGRHFVLDVAATEALRRAMTDKQE